MNKVILIGRLTKDPEIRNTQSGTAVARYSLAVPRQFKSANGQQETDFINCICFGKTAEFATKYLQKGTKIAIEGRLQTGSYQKKDGSRAYTTDVVVDQVEFCEKRNSQTIQTAPDQSAQPSFTDDFMAIPDEIGDDLPFV